MKKLLAVIIALSSLAAAPQAPASRPSPPEIRLVLLIAVDQFRYDYLTRFRSDFTSGFRRLLAAGAAMPIVEGLSSAPHLRGYAPLHAVRGDLLQQLARHHEARAEFERAADLTGNARERDVLLARAAACAG